MFDKELLEKEARMFTGPQDAYVHIEKRADDPLAMCVAGNPIALLYSAACICRRVSELTKTPVKETMKVLKDMCKVAQNMEEI